MILDVLDELTEMAGPFGPSNRGRDDALGVGTRDEAVAVASWIDTWGLVIGDVASSASNA